MSEVKFCENNFAQGVGDVKLKLENEMDNVNVEVEPCLGYCGDCAMGPFALVNDEFIQADTPEELYDKIKQELE